MMRSGGGILYNSCPDLLGGSNGLNLDDVATNLAGHRRLLSGQLVEGSQSGFIFGVEHINFVPDHQVIFRSPQNALTKTGDLVAIHRVFGAAHRIAHRAGEGLSLGGKRGRCPQYRRQKKSHLPQHFHSANDSFMSTLLPMVCRKMSYKMIRCKITCR